MSTALIGYTGFVGGNLAESEAFDLLINRANLPSIEGRHLDRLVCAGIPAVKWIANREPEADVANINRLCQTLDTITAERVVVISTIDVYPIASGADEGYDCGAVPNHAYGTNRLGFERYIRKRFPHAQIARLPALFGPRIRKNVIYDLLHDNSLDAINADSQFQWYPVRRLHDALRIVESHKLPVVNLFTEPIRTRKIIDRFFPGKRVGGSPGSRADYDLRTRYAALFGGQNGYVLDRASVLIDLGRFIEDERALQ